MVSVQGLTTNQQWCVTVNVCVSQIKDEISLKEVRPKRFRQKVRNAYHLCTNQKRPSPSHTKKINKKHKHTDGHTSILCFPHSVSALHADWRQIEIKCDVRTLATPNLSNAALNVTHTRTQTSKQTEIIRAYTST